MADNYLENKFDEFFGNGTRTVVKRVGHSLDELLTKNRSTRGYDKKFVVNEDMLRRVVAVNKKVASARNQQVLRFRLVTKGREADIVNANIKMGAALPELHLPFPETEPEAFIIICTTAAETKMVDIDLGIAAQSMLLKAVDMGLNGLCIGAFDKKTIMAELHLDLEPILILAIGKSIEKIQTVEIEETQSHAYYRENGIHYVPKIKDLILTSNF